jgi:hypothetical protein
MIVHELKLQQPFFDDVFFSRKDFEVRKNDRNFKVGDRLKLIEFPSENPRYVLKDVKYILDGGEFGIESGYVVLGLKDIYNYNVVSVEIDAVNSLQKYINSGKKNSFK